MATIPIFGNITQKYDKDLKLVAKKIREFEK
jgi:hypothetical protein